jgi:hypothetical protein
MHRARRRPGQTAVEASRSSKETTLPLPGRLASSSRTSMRTTSSPTSRSAQPGVGVADGAGHQLAGHPAGVVDQADRAPRATASTANAPARPGACGSASSQARRRSGSSGSPNSPAAWAASGVENPCPKSMPQTKAPRQGSVTELHEPVLNCRTSRYPDQASRSGPSLLLNPSSFVLPVILAVIPQATTEPNQTGLTRNAAQPDLPRPNWTVETRRLAVIS